MQEISWAGMFTKHGFPFELKLESVLTRETLIRVLSLSSPENEGVIKSIIWSKDLVTLQKKIQPINIQQFEQGTKWKKVDTEMFGMFWSYLLQERHLRSKTVAEIATFVQAFFTSNGSEFTEIRKHIKRNEGYDENNPFINAFESFLRPKSRKF